MVFGRNPILTHSLLWGPLPVPEDIPEYEYNRFLEEALYEIHIQAKEKMQASMQAVKNRADLKSYGDTFQEGTYVWLLKGPFQKGCRKFARKYDGPYKIMKTCSPSSYMLQSLTNPENTFKAHFNRLKRCNLTDHEAMKMEKALLQRMVEEENTNQEQDNEDQDNEDPVIFRVQATTPEHGKSLVQIQEHQPTIRSSTRIRRPINRFQAGM